MVQPKEVWLYANTQADNDNLSGNSNVCFRASDIVGFNPITDTALYIYLKPVRNIDANGGLDIYNDLVTITLTTANTHRDFMEVLMRNINNTRPTFSGFIDLVDDHTVIVGGAAASRTIASGLTSPAGLASKLTPLIASCGGINLAAANVSTHEYRLPSFGTASAAPVATAAGALALNTAYTNSETAAKAYTLPSAAAGRKGDWITVKYKSSIANGNLHSYHCTTDAQFALGSMITVNPCDATRIGVVDVSVADDDEVQITGLTNGDGGIGTSLKFLNTTGELNGWVCEVIVEGQGACSAASATTVFAA
tara:strand:+ start:255 stop:1181 length:927 start_codon:yes stop_codon:yes gene_type:complete